MDVWRPEPPVDEESIWSRFVAWVKFVGPAKVVGTGAGVLIAGIIGWSLVRPSTPGAEATLGTLAPSATAVDAAAVAIDPKGTIGGRIMVHVAGSVRVPGVYEVAAGSRVIDAVTAAGGPLVRAAVDAVNLAAPIVDGEKIYLPAVGEIVTASMGGTSTAAGSASTALVNVNTATADQLDTLPGIGPSTAAAIIARRDEVGRFNGPDDLLAVPGIGPAKVDAIRGLITF